MNSARRLLFLLTMTYLMILAPLTFFQRSLIYHPRRCDRLLARNSGLDCATIDVTVKSFDGLNLNGWLVLAETTAGSQSIDACQALSNDRLVVLYFPGNAGNRSMRTTQMHVFASLGVSTMLVDYRGYGDNVGKPSEQNFARDARSAWNHLTQEFGVPAHRIVICGESLGGGVATRLASELCEEAIVPGGLIIQSTFNSLVTVAQHHFPIVPVSLVLVDRYMSDRRIRHVICSILQIHGTNDSIVPFWSGQRLFDAANATSSSGVPKRQCVMKNYDHNDVYTDAEQPDSKLVDELKDFFDVVANSPSPDAIPTSSESPRLPTNQKSSGIASYEFVDWTIVTTIGIIALAAVFWWNRRARAIPPK